MKKRHQNILTTLGLTLALGSLATQADSGSQQGGIHVQEKSLGYPMSDAGERYREERSLAVGFADLNLNRQAGVNTLYQRLEQATALVCGPRESGRELARHRDWAQCYKTAMDRAIADIDHLGLDQLHLARTGRRISRGEEFAGR